MAKRVATPTGVSHTKTLALCVYAPGNTIQSPEYYNEEFMNLIATLGTPVDETLVVKVRNLDNNQFFTKGKLADFAAYVQEHSIEEVLISEPLTPIQERNLEEAIGCPIFDREYIILSIFRNAAKTSEGKIQVEMAEIEFMRTRLIGKGKEYAQQAGFIGGRGPGETIKEEIKRHFAEKYRQAHKKIVTLHNARETQRKQRLAKNIPLISIVGYTNAGKSSLLNRITKSDVLAEDKLFATLDITTRELYVDKDRRFLVSDTVGFISNLPHSLVEAFKSTLDELKYASLLLHVVDLSNPSWADQIKVVETTLREIGVQDKPVIFVFNKIDKLSAEELEALQPRLVEYAPHIMVSTMSKEGVQPLLNLIATLEK